MSYEPRPFFRILFSAFCLLLVAGCQKAPSTADKASAGATPTAETGEGLSSQAAIEFDPANPPPGYINCHRNHCHRQGGGVASYEQVMAEMGATSMKGVKQEPPPPVPADVAAPPADAQKTPSGLASKVLTPGKPGTKPTATSTVSIHYSGWTTDGKMFDSSVARGEPVKMTLGRVIPGFSEGIQLMELEESRRFWIPQDLAYKGRPGAPAGMLVFDVELLEIQP